jgi:hypothetical protein
MEDECYTLVVKASMGCAFVIERAGRGGKLFSHKKTCQACMLAGFLLMKLSKVFSKNLPGLYAGRFFTDQK